MTRTQYQCEDLNIEVAVLSGEAVRATLPGRDVRLPRVEAASGTRYAEAETEFWSRGGDEATLTLAGEERRSCTAIPGRLVWAEARDRSVGLRVAGNEPGWYAEVGRGEAPSMRLVLDYGERELTFEDSSPLGDSTGFRAEAAGDTATLRVERTPCRDSMSGWAFPLEARLEVNDRSYRGCGRSYEANDQLAPPP